MSAGRAKRRRLTAAWGMEEESQHAVRDPGFKVNSLHREFARVGRDLFLAGLVTTHGGNISVRAGDRIIITRHGAMLGRLDARDLVEASLESDGQELAAASSETVVHRAVYRETPAKAVIHAHPITAIFLSLLDNVIIPVDAEGACLLGRVPVVGAAKAMGSAEAAGAVSKALREHRAVVLRGHGSFAVGQALEEALYLTSALEASSRILAMARSQGEDLKD